MQANDAFFMKERMVKDIYAVLSTNKEYSIKKLIAYIELTLFSKRETILRMIDCMAILGYVVIDGDTIKMGSVVPPQLQKPKEEPEEAHAETEDFENL
jgi:hypothetical protein